MGRAKNAAAPLGAKGSGTPRVSHILTHRWADATLVVGHSSAVTLDLSLVVVVVHPRVCIFFFFLDFYYEFVLLDF